MQKIASPQELQAEIRAIMAFVHASEKPDRQVIASKLRELAGRLAAVKKEKIPESERDSWKDSVRRNKGKYNGPNGLKSGQKYKYQGKDWLIMDFDADSKAPGGATLVLVSPDFKETVRWVQVPGAKKAAGPGYGRAAASVRRPGPFLEIDDKVWRVTAFQPHEGEPAMGTRTIGELGWGRIQKVTLKGKTTGKEREFRLFKPPKISLAINRGRFLSTTYKDLGNDWKKKAGDYDRTSAAKSLGRPDVLHGMKFGGTRYKYDFGIFIDHVEKDDTFHVNQAGRPTKKLGTAKSLKDAEKIALKKGDLSWT
jgi:hypothetical protein